MVDLELELEESTLPFLFFLFFLSNPYTRVMMVYLSSSSSSLSSSPSALSTSKYTRTATLMRVCHPSIHRHVPGDLAKIDNVLKEMVNYYESERDARVIILSE